MFSIKFIIVVALTLCAVLPSTLGVPIFWFPWSYLLPTTSSSSGSGSSSSSSSSTTFRPIMANISIGNRRNTSAMVDSGTVINGLTISRGRRDVPLETIRNDPSVTSESFIQVGNQVIRLPPGNVANLTINIIDGVPYVFGNTESDVSSGSASGSSEGMSGLFSRVRNFFGDLLGRNPNAN
ncbi:uncharacterized protein LOC5574465 [Aedes aegypti]|uniref:Uncharacterized protein n=1 Tax=Aedes aegypti TaxID=7159 RepID=A0A1S4FSG7_AEDAE|nr:uncharacterized protein LOC5574465 [Aedes aegypti]